jgi:endonuclease/exonuclease/phosphatase (EEP) superfamily protein YafD
MPPPANDQPTPATTPAPAAGLVRSGAWLVAWLVAWLAVAVLGLVVLSQAVGRTPIAPVYALQALTPYLLAPSVGLAVVALLRGRRLMAGTSACITAGLLWLVVPVALHGGTPWSAPPGAPTFTIVHSNAYFRTGEPAAAAAALLDEDADVIAVTEQSPQLEAALAAAGVDERYPFRVGSSSELRNGVSLYSRLPFVEASVRDIGGQPAIDATINTNSTGTNSTGVNSTGTNSTGTNDGIVRVLVVHPLPGVDRAALGELRRGLALIDAVGRADTLPTVVVGDFNASRWHPDFRRLLQHWTDAHGSLGHGLSVSWPAHWVLPPFVRLDHALMDDGVTALAVHDVDVPGSDHRGFTVTLAIDVMFGACGPVPPGLATGATGCS